MIRYLCIFLIMFFSHLSCASIAVNKSRIIFTADSHDAGAITVANSGSADIVLQSWIDDGVYTRNGNQVITPFVVVPAVAKINPGEVRTFKILKTSDIPSDKGEKLYWLNLYEVELGSKKNDNAMRVGVNTQIKVFYQPSGLTGRKSDSARLIVPVINIQSGKEILSLKNNSDFCISLSKITVMSGHYSYAIPDGMDMTLMPHSQMDFPLSVKGSHRATSLLFSVINDDGTVSRVTKDI